MHPQFGQKLWQVPGCPRVALSPWQQSQSTCSLSVPVSLCPWGWLWSCPCRDTGRRHRGVPAPVGCAWIKLFHTAVRPLQYLSYCPYNETLLLVIARRLNLSKDTVSEY